MHSSELKFAVNRLRQKFKELTATERLKTTHLLIDAAHFCVEGLRENVSEKSTALNKQQSKSRETKVDPKPPVSPVRVAEPTKPKKPKYSGNHAPSARR